MGQRYTVEGVRAADRFGLAAPAAIGLAQPAKRRVVLPPGVRIRLARLRRIERMLIEAEVPSPQRRRLAGEYLRVVAELEALVRARSGE